MIRLLQMPRGFPARRTNATLIALASLAAWPGPLRAGPVAGSLAVDQYALRDGQTTRAASAVVALGIPAGGFVSAGASRYDDTIVGAGWSATAGLGARLASPLSVRVWGTRFLGERGDRAWRLKAGPAVSFPSGAGLGVYYLRQRDDRGPTADGVAAEGAVPIAPRWRAMGSTSIASADLGGGKWSGSAGLGWSLIPNVELSAALGVASGTALAPGGPAGPGGGGGGGGGGPLPLPLPIPIFRAGMAAGSDPASNGSGARPSLEVAARVSFP